MHARVAAFEMGDRVRFTRFGGGSLGPDAGCTLSNDLQSVVCDKAGVSSVVRSAISHSAMTTCSPGRASSRSTSRRRSGP